LADDVGTDPAKSMSRFFDDVGMDAIYGYFGGFAVVPDERPVEADMTSKKAQTILAKYQRATDGFCKALDAVDAPNVWKVYYNANDFQDAHDLAAKELKLDVNDDRVHARACELLLLHAKPAPFGKPLASYDPNSKASYGPIRRTASRKLTKPQPLPRSPRLATAASK
jgi:hypothetical protein